MGRVGFLTAARIVEAYKLRRTLRSVQIPSNEMVRREKFRRYR